jgi:hypothetical protein
MANNKTKLSGILTGLALGVGPLGSRGRMSRCARPGCQCRIYSYQFIQIAERFYQGLVLMLALVGKSIVTRKLA